MASRTGFAFPRTSKSFFAKPRKRLGSGVGVSISFKYFALVILGLSLVGCASSETRSLVNKDDLPASKYKNVAIFIENLEEAERLGAEQIVLSALQNSGINAVSGQETLKRRGAALTENAKAALIQKQFDAVMYVRVAQKGQIEELIPNAYFDGQMVQINVLGIATVGHNLTDLYIIKPDGSVYQSMVVLKTVADFQDTKTAKQIWTSETISSGNARGTNMAALFTQASRQIVEKLRADNVM